MRNRSVFAIAMLAVLSVRCSGGSAADTHQSPDAGPGGPGPNDQDYSSRFAGTWNGSATVTTNGHSQTAGVSQRIDNVGFNQLALLEMCRGAAGVAVIDSATSFSMDPRTCRPTDELHLPLAVLAVSTPACGATTVRYERGRGNLAQNVLTTTLEGNASGCGQTLPFKLTFTGTLASGVGTQSSVRLQSEPGDPVGFGGTYAYTKADAQISVRPTERGRLDISVDGDQTWLGFLQMPSGF